MILIVFQKERNDLFAEDDGGKCYCETLAGNSGFKVQLERKTENSTNFYMYYINTCVFH